MNYSLHLEFHGAAPQLTRTSFSTGSGEPRIAVRGKTEGATRGAGTFQWTSAVRAISVLFLEGVVLQHEGRDVSEATLSGFGGSLASTLDYALSKEPVWTVDMFGVDVGGRTLLRRLLRRTNPERKYPGPVTVGIAPGLFASQELRVSWDGVDLWNRGEIGKLRALIELAKAPIERITSDPSEPSVAITREWSLRAA